MNVRCYKRFSTIPPITQREIRAELQLVQGKQYRFAVATESPCSVGYERGIAVGWAALIPEHNPDELPQMMAFVMPYYRRRGLGKRLVYALLDHTDSWDQNILISEHSKRSEKFFQACGF